MERNSSKGYHLSESLKQFFCGDFSPSQTSLKVGLVRESHRTGDFAYVPKYAKELFDFLNNTTNAVTCLSFDRSFLYHTFGESGAMEIANGIAPNTTLRSLNISFLGIGGKGANWIAKALERNSTLLDLNLSNNNLGVEGAMALADSLCENSTLQQLKINNNSIKDEGVKVLGVMLPLNSTLQRLEISNNQITSEGARLLCEALTVNLTLKWINISHNTIEDLGAKYLSIILAQNTNLQGLNLNSNQITSRGGREIAKMIKQNTTLRTLILSRHLQDHPEICESLCANTTLTSIGFPSSRTIQYLKFNSYIVDLEFQCNPGKEQFNFIYGNKVYWKDRLYCACYLNIISRVMLIGATFEILPAEMVEYVLLYVARIGVLKVKERMREIGGRLGVRDRNW